MELTELEKVVVRSMLADRDLRPLKSTINFDAIRVRDRDFTGIGFLTDFEPAEELRLFDSGVSLRWGKVGARLGSLKVDTGYLVYVDDGYITTVEGYTYGEDWPADIEPIELYDF